MATGALGLLSAERRHQIGLGVAALLGTSLAALTYYQSEARPLSQAAKRHAQTRPLLPPFWFSVSQLLARVVLHIFCD